MLVRINFDEVDSAGGPAKLPEGEYLCVCASARGMDEPSSHWLVTWRVADGPLTGSTVADRFFFTVGALPRLKLLFDCLGLRTTGEQEVDPHMLRGRKCWVSVEDDEYEGKQRSKVPFAGYRRYAEPKTPAPEYPTAKEVVKEEEDDFPF